MKIDLIHSERSSPLCDMLEAIVKDLEASSSHDNPDGWFYDAMSLRLDDIKALLQPLAHERSPSTMLIDLIHREPGSPLVFLADEATSRACRGEPELQRAWEILAHTEQTDTLAEHAGEVWQYLGTSFDADRGEWVHTFRHRCHPRTEEREYRYIPARLALTLDELWPGPANYRVTVTTQIGFDGQHTIYGIYRDALLVIGVEKHGARLYFGDAQLVDRRKGHRYLPRSVQLEWAAEYATPSAPAFTFQVDPVDDEVYAHVRSLEEGRLRTTASIIGLADVRR